MNPPPTLDEVGPILDGLKPGQRYRVRFRGPRIKEMVADFLGAGGNDGKQAQFSLRPAAGTVTLRRQDITQMWETGAEIRLPHHVTDEVRVY